MIMKNFYLPPASAEILLCPSGLLCLSGTGLNNEQYSEDEYVWNW